MNGLLRLHRLLHRQASAECRRKALEVLDRVFTNIVTYPSSEKYRRINMASVMWERYVASSFYLFQFLEWLESLGFVHDAEHSVLQFGGDELNGVIGAREEVRILCEAYLVPCSKEDNKGSVEGKQLLSLLRFIAGLTDNGGLGSDVPLQAKDAQQACINSETWDNVKSLLYVAVLSRVCAERGGVDFGSQTASQPPLTLRRSWAWSSLIEAACEVSLSQMEDDFSVVEAELFDSYEHINYGASDITDSLKESVRRRVAEKHKNDFSSSDQKFAHVHAEVNYVATRLIADIASCMEQVAVLEETQGMVRRDRLEAHKLLNKFREDADIGYLHSLKEEWRERLEAAKEKHGKPFVYLQTSASESYAR
ncbi:hypothetical protein TraAM80_01737 [Trypanosoma rangeli]|uniref:PUB domain-containing protein n=1 Tax=Trypanosoma rangeli TaxID=5698 RepID=A0A422NXE9_TRYRA|nr:uncharacterized protein TraAM80_01737 [Trypanosoma rangeli]RNF10160.1 hypothetical protein TraAM80_01737 [Trypanosoma rangeli]|eukprot:RNF10160.1 hypothetical protein TraAM80_01737 [Trypanosoma rangeli]